MEARRFQGRGEHSDRKAREPHHYKTPIRFVDEGGDARDAVRKGGITHPSSVRETRALHESRFDEGEELASK